MSDAQSFGSYLKQAMDAVGLSIADLKRLTGISDSLISKWRNDQVLPTVDKLRLMSPHLLIPTRDLVVRAGHMRPEEVGLVEPPKLPSAPPTLVDDIRASDKLSDAGKETAVAVVRALEAEYEREQADKGRKG